MANDILGSELNISGLEDGIARIEKKMTALSANMTRNSNNIINAFQNIGTQGVQQLLNKLTELQTAMNKVNAPQQQQKTNPYAKNVDNINKMMAALDKSSGVWSKLQTNINKNETEIAKLTAATHKFQSLQSKIKTTGSGVISQKEKKEYAENLKTLEVLKQQVASWKQKQQQIDAANKSLVQEVSLQQQIARGATQPVDSKTQQKRAELAQMNEMYRQQEVQLKKNYEAQARLNQQKNQAKNTTFEGAMKFSDNATSINRQSKAIEYLTQARAKLNVTTADGQRQAEQLTQRIRQHEDAIKRATRTEQENEQAMRRRNEALTRQRQLEQQKRISSSPQEAMAYSRTTKTINEQIMAIQALKTARDRLTVQQAGGQMKYAQEMVRLNAEIKRQQSLVDTLRGKQQQLGQSQMNLMNIGRQLGSQLAMVFSVSAIQGYINKMVSVRAEFELQQRSLQAILQNKDAANKIWGQTVDLALRSPFRVKELVTYTKQLAAYRIETDKLHEKTKQLADVSAGLGVDMQRLILAYGQVRAAEYLRGTELRQFTEAGIPMLEELARYFSELEGTAVSTGEVFERISKRLVRFSDVAEVFNRITSAGGVFYQMQEKQADTLHGQISNLHDALDLMMNDIGKGNDSILKSFVAGLRAIVDNWEEVWIRIKEVIIALGAYKIAAVAAGLATKQTGGILLTMTNSWGKYARALKIANVRQLSLLKGATAGRTAMILLGSGMRAASVAAIGLGRAMMAILPVLLIAGIFELINRLGEAGREAERLQEALQGVEAELSKDLSKGISTYVRLANVISDLTRSYTERKEAEEELQRTFKDTLPSIYTESEAIIEMAGNYDKATDALRTYYEEKARFQKIEVLDTHYQDRFKGDIKESWNKDQINRYVPEIQENEYLQILANVVQKGRDKIKNEGILWSAEDLKNEFANALQEYYGFSDQVKAHLKHSGLQGIATHNLGDIADLYKEYQKDFSTIGGLSMTPRHLKQEAEDLRKLKLKYEEYKTTLQDITSLYGKYSSLQSKARKNNTQVPEEDAKAIEKELKDKYAKIGVEIPVNLDFKKVAEDSFALETEMDRVGTTMRTNFINANTAITSADNSILTMSDKLGGMSTIPTPPILSGIKIATNDAENLNTMLAGGVVQSAEELSNMDTPPMFQYLPTVVGDIENVNGAWVKMVEDVTKESDDVVDSTFQNLANNTLTTLADSLGISHYLLQDFFVASGEAQDQTKQNWENTYKELEAKLSRTRQMLLENPLVSPHIIYTITGTTEEEYQKGEQTLQAVKDAYKKMGWGDITGNKSKSKKGRSKKQEDPAKDFANVLKEIRDSYEDLNDWMGKNDAIDATTKDWQKTFEEAAAKVKGFSLSFKKFDFTTVNGLIDALKQLKEAAKLDKTKTDIEKLISKISTADKKEAAKETADKRDREIDQLFEMYELYKELEKINIPTDWAKSFFNIDATSLTDLRSRLEANEYRFVGEEGAEEYQKYLDKLSEMEQKEQEERLKTYLQYARDAVGERAKIKLEELKKLSVIEQAAKPLETDTEEVKEQKEQAKKIAMQKVKDESAQATKKLEWEEFQKSDTFMSLFEDLDNASIALMDHTLEKIRNFKNEWADMPLEDVKAMTDKINQLENAIELAKNPFTAVKNIRKKVEEETGQKLKSPEELDTEGAALDAENERLNKEIASLEVIRSLKSENKNLDDDQIDVLNNLNISTGVTTDELDKQITQKKDLLAKNNKDIQNVNKQKQANKDITKAYNSQAEALKNIDKMANDVYDAFSEIWEVVGNDEMAKVWADMGMSIVSSVFQATALIMQLTGAKTAAEAFGKAMNSAMGIVGLIVMAVQIVAQVLSAAFKAHDDKKQKEIDEEIKSIERLEKELENLEERLEAVYSLGGVNKSMRQVQANIDTQIQSYEKMMRLEEEKKSTDKEQIDEWKENIEELREKRKELHKEMVESLGGNYDIRSVAREFVDAWIDAFKETGDGLKGLRDNFKDFFLNILLEQAVMQKVGSFFSDAMDYLNNTVLSDYIVTDAERKQTEGMFDEAMIKTDDYLNLLFGENGVLNKYIDDTDSSLSGLQQGIQGVTEETAQIIEAYLNSIRFYIAQDNQNLAKLVDTFTNVESPNPILNELRTQTELITSIRDLFRDVVRMGHPTYGGAFLKVAL